MRKMLFLLNPEQNAKTNSEINLNIIESLGIYNNLAKCALEFFDKIIVFEDSDKIKVKLDECELAVSYREQQDILKTLRDHFFAKDKDKAYIFNMNENNFSLEKCISLLKKEDIYKKVLILPRNKYFDETIKTYKTIEKEFSGESNILLIDFAMSCENAFKNRYLEFDHFFIFLNRNKGCYTEFIHSATKLQMLHGTMEVKDKFKGRRKKIPSHIAVVKDHGKSVPIHNRVFFDQDDGCILILEDDVSDNENLKSALNTIFNPPEIFISYGNFKEDNELINRFRKELQDRFPLANTLIDREDIPVSGNLVDFIDRIKNGEHILLFMNDKYLKSEYCIDELHGIYEASKNKTDEIRNRIHPFVLDSASYLYNEKKFLDEMRPRWEKNQSRFEFIKKIPEIIGTHYNIPRSEILSENRIDQIILSIENKIIKSGRVSNYRVFRHQKV